MGQKMSQNLGGGAKTDVGNQGGINWGGVGQQVQDRQGTTYGNFLAQQTAGMQPSIAQAQLKQATDQNIANQMAMAASGRGGNFGTNQRLAAQGMASAGQQMAQQSGMLAAQEGQMNATNALAYQHGNDQFQQGMYGLSNQRDLGIASVDEEAKKRAAAGTQGFMNFLSGAGKAAATGGTL